jgi:chitinase
MRNVWWLRTGAAVAVVLLLGVGVGVRGLGAATRARGVEDAPHELVVGYFPQWGIYSEPKFLVRTLVTSGAAGKLDQINYAQGSVVGGHCSIADVNADLMRTFDAEESVSGKADKKSASFRGNFHQIEELKRRYPKLKVLISLEGRAANFAEDARPEKRKAFVASCVDLFVRGRLAEGVRKPRLFDGIDVNWEFPQMEDAGNFVALLKEMRRQMDAVRPGLRLTVAVGPSPKMYPGVDMTEVAKVVDLVGVMNYDYHGPWSKTTGFLAPLSGDPKVNHEGTVEGSMAAYREAGVPGRKLLVGLPFYGYGWKGVEDENHGLYQEGKGIREDRSYRYIESLGEDYERFRDELSGAPWRFDGDTFWTYEDVESTSRKSTYAREQKLGGVMIWELSGDGGKGELLNAVREGLDGVMEIRSYVGGGR